MRLPTRLALGLFVLLVGHSAWSMFSLLETARLHRQEAYQRMNLDLARDIAGSEHGDLIDAEGALRQADLEELFHWMMVVNPGLQFYLLAEDGTVRAFDPMPGPIASDRVDLAPVHALLDGGASLPLLGDDPRSPGQRKIFSVTPLEVDGEKAGYLYIVLDNAPVESALERLQTSSMLRHGLKSVLFSLVAALLLGAFLFGHLTAPLRRLTARMRSFHADRLGASESVPGDEVEQLTRTFGEMVERIDEQVRAIEEMAASRNELIANVSHDLRTPIATLLGYLETLSLKSGLAAGDRAAYLEIALRQAERLKRLVEELFELTKLDAHDIAARVEPFQLPELVQDNVQHFELQAQHQGVRLRAELPTDLPPVLADIGLIERALQNLLENALQYTPEGGDVLVEVTIAEPGSGLETVGGEWLEVRVRDTGCGISDVEQGQVFDRYYRARRGPNGSVDPGDGSGLGLAIAQKILRLHGGEIRVESEENRGSTFRFVLPVANRPAA